MKEEVKQTDLFPSAQHTHPGLESAVLDSVHLRLERVLKLKKSECMKHGNMCT